MDAAILSSTTIPRHQPDIRNDVPIPQHLLDLAIAQVLFNIDYVYLWERKP